MGARWGWSGWEGPWGSGETLSDEVVPIVRSVCLAGWLRFRGHGLVVSCTALQLGTGSGVITMERPATLLIDLAGIDPEKHRSLIHRLGHCYKTQRLAEAYRCSHMPDYTRALKHTFAIPVLRSNFYHKWLS